MPRQSLAAIRAFAEHHAGCRTRNGRVVAYSETGIVISDDTWQSPISAVDCWVIVAQPAYHGQVAQPDDIQLLCRHDWTPEQHAKASADWRKLLGWARTLRKGHARQRAYHRDEGALIWRVAKRHGQGIDSLSICPGCGAAYITVDPQELRRIGRTLLPHACTVCKKGRTCGCCACVICRRCHAVVDAPAVICPDCHGHRNGAGRCCSCQYCACGANMTGYTCRICHRGRNCGCCHCVFCPRCNVHVLPPAALCRHCRKCEGCCTCGGVEWIEAPEPPHFYAALDAQRAKNDSPRYIAAEIEIAEIERGKFGPIHDVIEKWHAAVVHDGSLPQGGFEINTAPASGDLYLAQVKEICAALTTAGARITDHCGLHVHVDARDFDFYGIRRLVRLYAAMETALFEMVPPERRANRYCIPCGFEYSRTIARGRIPKDAVKKGIVKAVYKADLDDDALEDTRTNKYVRPARYAALNLHSWFFRGTVECRLFNGTRDPAKIGAWGVLWARILDRAFTSTDEEIEPMVDGRNGREIVRAFAPDGFVRRFIEGRWQVHGGAGSADLAPPSVGIHRRRFARASRIDNDRD